MSYLLSRKRISMKNSLISRLILAGSTLLIFSSASGGISLNSTRAILQAPSKEVAVVVRNLAPQDILLQSWVDTGSKQKDPSIPFVVTPPISVLGGNKQQVLRILYQGQGLQSDRESVFWLNVQEIPQKTNSDNSLQIAVRQRIKIFYRPAGLSGTVEEAYTRLRWKLEWEGSRPRLKVINNSEYSISFARIELVGGNGSRYLVEPDMVSPKSYSVFELKKLSAIPNRSDGRLRIEYQKINDYGGLDAHHAELSE